MVLQEIQMGIFKHLLAGSFIMFLSCSSRIPHDTIRGTIGSEPPTFDPALATDSVSYLILSNTMEGLTIITPELDVEPGLAEKWETKDKGKTWVFHIRDAKWSDGKQVSAYDFLYAWKRVLSPETGAEYAYFLYPIKGALEFNMGITSQIGVNVIDEKTLFVELEKPLVFFPYLVAFMSTYPQRKDLVEKYGEKWAEPPHGAYTGPYVIKDFIRDYRVVLEKNPEYYRKNENLTKRIELFVVSDPSTRIALYERKKIHYLSIPPFLLPHIGRREDLISNTVLRGNYIGFNLMKYPFSITSVRKAFAMAIDRNEIIKVLGGGIPATSWIPPGMFAHNPQKGLRFNPALAKELLSQSGVKIDNVSLHISYSPENLLLAQNLQEQWRRNLGISVKIEMMEWKAYLSTLKIDPPPLYILGWGADYPDPDNFMTLFTGTSGNNHTGWKNEIYDALIIRARAEVDPSIRKSLYDRAQEILLEEECVIVPISFSVSYYLVNRCLKNFNPGPMDLINFFMIDKEC